MKTYRLEQARVLTLQLLMLGLFLVAAVGLLVAVLLGAIPPREAPPLPFLLVFGLIIAFIFLRQLRVPREIRVDSEGHIEMVGPLLRVALRPGEILSIGPTQEPGFFVLRHESGKVRFFNQFTGFHELLAWLKEANPHVDLKGC